MSWHILSVWYVNAKCVMVDIAVIRRYRSHKNPMGPISMGLSCLINLYQLIYSKCLLMYLQKTLTLLVGTNCGVIVVVVVGVVLGLYT